MVVAVRYGIGEIPRKSSDPSSSHPKKNFFLTYSVSSKRVNSETQSFLSATVFDKVFKKHYLEISGRACLVCGTQTSIFKDKHPERSI